jgi:hypothetical protein
VEITEAYLGNYAEIIIEEKVNQRKKKKKEEKLKLWYPSTEKG